VTERGARRHDARERALGLLYEAQAKGVPADDVIAALPVPPDEYAAELAAGVAAHEPAIDGLLGGAARGWTVERMPVVDRTVLRMAVFELLHQPDVPTAVVIDEAVELAKQFSTDDSGRFVNGVLGRIARDVRGAAGSPVDVLLVDVDGVLRHWHDHEVDAAEDALGLPRGAIAEVAFEEALMQLVITGGMTDAAWRTHVADELAARYGVDAVALSEFWNGRGWTVDESVLAVLADVRGAGRCRVALFSNATDRLEDDMRQCGISDAVDSIVNSATLRLAKPDPLAFAAAAAALDTEPDRCLFVDDRAANVDGARQAGMRAELFTSADALRELVRSAGLVG
jgi:transcription antitermination factor NusB